MKKKFRKALADALHAPRTIRIRERTDQWLLHGYVVGLSDAFVLLHQIDGGTLTFNGYVALPLPEIADLPEDRYDDFEHRALQLRGEEPVRQPDILLLDFPGLLSSANAHFPLVTLHTAHLHPDECWIGRVAKLTKKSVTLREINPAAQWREPLVKYRFRDITRVEFGGGYEDALWRVSEYEKESARSQNEKL